MAAIIVIINLILLFFLAFAAVDAFFVVRDILKRRGIGTFASDKEWFSAAKGAADKWLEKGIPIVPKKAESRLVLLDILKGEYQVNAIQCWQEASVLLAANEYNPSAGEKFIRKKLSQKELFETDRVDAAMLGYAMLKNKNADKQEIKPYMDKLASMLIKKYEENGRIPYGGNKYICFVDTIGLVCPFLAEYSLAYGDKKTLEAAMKIIKDFSQKGIHNELYLPVHCYDDRNNAPLGIYGWGRGCGWWATGLADTYAALEKEDGFESEKSFILKETVKFADTITKYQCKNGAFDRNVLHFSGEDSSATAMIGYFLAYAGRITGSEDYKKSALKAMKYLYSVTRTDGVTDWSQGDTAGVGFYSTESIVVPAAQGFALRAYMMLEEGSFN